MQQVDLWLCQPFFFYFLPRREQTLQLQLLQAQLSVAYQTPNIDFHVTEENDKWISSHGTQYALTIN